MPGPVDEEQRDRVALAPTPLVDYLKHVAHGWGRPWAPARRQQEAGPDVAAPANPVVLIGGADICGRRDSVFLCPGNLQASF
jgi:hypothetical protein